MAIKIKPLSDRVLIQPLEEKEISNSGIIIPDTAKEKPQEGKIVAVGPGKTTDDGKTVALTVKVGDTVIYGKYAGTEIKYEGEDYLLVREDDIQGIIE
jgi:chaperonin GroES